MSFNARINKEKNLTPSLPDSEDLLLNI